MVKGGYQIIDISGVKFELPGSAKIKGVYEKVSGTTKPIMISDFTVGGIHERALFVQLTRNETTLEYSTVIANNGGHYLITIRKDDTVKIENV